MEMLGKQVKDKITGFEGIVVGKTTYLFGCNVYGIAPPAKDGKVNDTSWFDAGRLEVIGEGVSPADVQEEKPGGLSMSAPNNISR